MQAENIRDMIVTELDELKAQDIRVLDVRELTSIADYMVIATGTSDRHVKAMANKLIESLKHAGQRPLGVEGEKEGEWVLVDFGDVITHLMLPQVRDFYKLESLWELNKQEVREQV